MAFNDEYDDYEQSEHVRQWLRANGMAIAGGIILGLLVIFGLQQWRTHQANHRAQAADHYEQMVQAISADNQPAANNVAGILQDQYKDTPYAVFSALQQAKQDVASGKPAQALPKLAWAYQHAGDGALKSLITLRTARVQLSSGQAEQALTSLGKLPAKDFHGMAMELRGDALVVLKRNDDARKAYSDALTAYDADAPQRRLLQLKLDNLSVAGNPKA